MGKKYFFFAGIQLAISGFLISSCTKKSSNDEIIIKALNESLTNSNNLINMNSQTVIRYLREKANDFITMERAGYWLPKAELVQKKTTALFEYIDEIKNKKEIGALLTETLYKKMLSYRDDVLNADSSIKYDFSNNINLITQSFNTDISTGKQFSNIFFSNTNPILTNAILTKLQNNIKVIENKTLTYCLYKIGTTDGEGLFDSFSAIISQNSSVLRPGETLEIKAGIGSFNKASRPVIIINGNQIPLEDGGYSLYKIQVSGNPGKHYVPVKIEFTNQEGIQENHEFTVEYTVAKPCDQ